jgi:ribulose-5-phosphate 4-epimerase/fuculose-1-phosphate aldolase
MTAEGMRAKRRTTYQNMHEIVKLAKKYSPKLVKGYSAGNFSVVDKKSWLEVCDRKHRYVLNPFNRAMSNCCTDDVAD